jgi:protein-arginine kinase activator protein McsA
MRNEKGVAGNNATYQNIQFTGGKQGFDVFNYRRNLNNFQCKTCGGDYGKFATKSGVCQNCQQRVEFVIRECPDILQKVQNQNSRQGAIV